MNYFVKEEWEGPGPVVTFIFFNNQNNKYYLYDEYVDLIQEVLLKFNKNFFVAGITNYSSNDLKNILKYISMNDFDGEEKNEIIEELRKIIKKELSADAQIKLRVEGV